jgi:16S rRNA (guanine527-N7)-methyltransferase
MGKAPGQAGPFLEAAMTVSRETLPDEQAAHEADRAAFLRSHNVSRETLDRLDQIVRSLGEARTRMNLIGPNEWPHLWTRHIGDSWRLVPFVDGAARLVDLGSGAGFPALILSAAFPRLHVTLIESVGKKCVFLREAIEAAGLKAVVANERVEKVKVSPADIVTARAFAPLPELLAYAEPWMRSGATGLFLKGARWKEELTEARKTWNFAHEATEDRPGGPGIILEVRELRRVRHQA